MLSKADLLAIERRYVEHVRLLLDKAPMSDQNINLTPLYPDTDDIEALTLQVDDLKKCLDSLRPIPTEQVGNLQAAFDTQYTYDSNRIEGNTLTLNETAMVIEHGITIAGKPLKDHLEAINHRDAINLVRELVAHGSDLTPGALMDIHAIVLSGIDRHNAGRFRTTRVRVAGSAYPFPNPLKVPELMDDFFALYEAEKGVSHPVSFSAKVHARLVNIHPFVDGNGRTARLIMNFILLKNGYVVANISGDKARRGQYYTALERSHADATMSDFVRFVLATERASLMEYIAMLNPDIESNRGGYFLERIAPLLKT
jgi:Fic family protein